ncbi:hypothetical protein [Phocaeicola sartorii]
MSNADEAEYDVVLDTKLKGVFFLSQLVGKYMKEKLILPIPYRNGVYGD